MTVVQNDRSKFLLFQGNGFQRWCDSMGIPQIKLNSQYWTKLRHRIDTASEVIFQYQQENFRRAILDNDPKVSFLTEQFVSRFSQNWDKIFKNGLLRHRHIRFM